MFPRHLLSRHFWSPEQRVEFAEINLGNRLHHYPVILNYIIKHVRDISDENFKNQFSQVIIKVICIYSFTEYFFITTVLIL